MFVNNANFAKVCAGVAVAALATLAFQSDASASPYDAYRPFYGDLIGFQGVRRPSKAEFYAANPWAATRPVAQVWANSHLSKTRFYGYSYETNVCHLTYATVRTDRGALRHVPMDRCG